jgi:ATP adenylyltransferase
MAYPNNPSSPTDILSNLPAKFEEARKSGQLFFFPSEAKDVYSAGHRVGGTG